MKKKATVMHLISWGRYEDWWTKLNYTSNKKQTHTHTHFSSASRLLQFATPISKKLNERFFFFSFLFLLIKSILFLHLFPIVFALHITVSVKYEQQHFHLNEPCECVRAILFEKLVVFHLLLIFLFCSCVNFVASAVLD